jgi:hypothetical protein
MYLAWSCTAPSFTVTSNTEKIQWSKYSGLSPCWKMWSAPLKFWKVHGKFLRLECRYMELIRLTKFGSLVVCCTISFWMLMDWRTSGTIEFLWVAGRGCWVTWMLMVCRKAYQLQNCGWVQILIPGITTCPGLALERTYLGNQTLDSAIRGDEVVVRWANVLNDTTLPLCHHQLVTHFSNLFRHNQIKWPKSKDWTHPSEINLQYILFVEYTHNIITIFFSTCLSFMSFSPTDTAICNMTQLWSDWYFSSSKIHHLSIQPPNVFHQTCDGHT